MQITRICYLYERYGMRYERTTPQVKNEFMHKFKDVQI